VRRAVAVGLALVLGVCLTACGPYAPRSLPIVWSDDDVVGTWVHEADDTSTGATLEFDFDGTVAFEGLPIEVLSFGGSGCNDAIAGSTTLISGEGTWRWRDDRFVVDFSDQSTSTYVWPAGFLSFDRLEFICDVDGAGSYSLVRQEQPPASID